MIFDTRGWTPSTWTSAGSHAQPELGWALIRAHWGFGYATEAAAAIRDWAYESRSIDLLVSLISPDNVRSQRVAERLGATPTETVTPAHTKQKTVVWRHMPAACMKCQSPMCALAARTRTSTSSPPSSGWSMSLSSRTSAEPYLSCTIAFIGSSRSRGPPLHRKATV